MESKELRIGNLINVNGNLRYVFGTSYKKIQHNSHPINSIYSENYENECEPILLTDEWLLKFGYFKIEHKECHFVVKGHTIWICNNMYLCEKNGIILKYVHQLQNIYFSLTNTELNYDKV